MKEIKIMVNDDGTFDIDGTPVQSVEEAVAMVQESLDAGAGEAMSEGEMPEGEGAPEAGMPEGIGAPSSEIPEAGLETGAGELPPAEGMEAEGEMGEEEETSPKGRYAKKKGMRPKESASFDDYFAGAPR
jgi:hypothetical protein